MPRDKATRHHYDEDTQAFMGHMTNQASDEPESFPADRNRRQIGPERSPNQKDDQKRRKNDKPSRENRN
jgi:hypothetical protein